jgi:phospholipid/cholesterol/gamma-HCH transport system permease protein
MLTDARSDASAAALPPSIDARESDGGLDCTLSGVWTTRTVASVDADARALESRGKGRPVRLDLAGVERIDTAGAWLIERLVRALEKDGAEVSITGQSAAAETLLTAVGHATRKPDLPKPRKRGILWLAPFAAVGRAIYGLGDDFVSAMHILGATVRGAQMKLGRSHGVNPAAIFHQIDRIGVGAIPVIVLMSSVVGAIIAQQGAFQLRYFGAEFFVVDLVGILVLRELGVLMTAIMIAGRSGSAITAEIGSMKMREEVDALTVIGLNPVAVLVFPRLLALIIAVPCLTAIANFAALGGAIFLAWAYSGIEPLQFIDRLRAGIDLSTIFAGFIKAPFMAVIIGIIASVEGLKVEGSAESLGRHVTASVVKSIFLVVIVDGLFAIFYAAINY